jgi:hypothetical protein
MASKPQSTAGSFLEISVDVTMSGQQVEDRVKTALNLPCNGDGPYHSPTKAPNTLSLVKLTIS